VIILGTFIAVLFLARGTGFLAWALAALAAGGYYAWDVRRRPRVPCRACQGSGSNASRLGGSGWFRRPFGDCRCCGGRKSHPRLALRLLAPARYKDIKAEITKGRDSI
jgi:hypothetical protein